MWREHAAWKTGGRVYIPFQKKAEKAYGHHAQFHKEMINSVTSELTKMSWRL